MDGIYHPGRLATHRTAVLDETPRLRTGVLALTALAALAAVAVVARPAVDFFADPAAVRDAVAAYGPLAPAAFVLLVAVQVVVAPIPGHGVGVAAGYLFGAAVGTAVSVVGVALGSLVAVSLARALGRPAVERLVAPETLARFDAAVAERGVPTLLVVFLVPGLPDDAVCFAAGLTDVPVRRVVLLAAVGRAPSLALASAAGAGLATGRPTLAASLLAVLVALSLVGYRYRRQLGRLVGAERAHETARQDDGGSGR